MGPVSRPEIPIPVLATLHWLDGTDADVPASALAWTKDAVEVAWEQPPVGLTRDWIPAGDVRRGQAAAERIKQVTDGKPGRQEHL
jgi:hypothetical protein